LLRTDAQRRGAKPPRRFSVQSSRCCGDIRVAVSLRYPPLFFHPDASHFKSNGADLFDVHAGIDAGIVCAAP
jgi:hypothetical protein